MAPDDKNAGAFRTIGEVAAVTGIAPHILRYWEGRFPQLRPVTRAGRRRYYRPADVELVQRIDRLLNREGYTVRGVQQLLAAEAGRGAKAPLPTSPPPPPSATLAGADDLLAIRHLLAAALDDDLAFATKG